jgi:prepilin-type N-terminal cleavage/methylation domain-containing protein
MERTTVSNGLKTTAREAGFTLMEIMIVLAIILSLFGFLIGPRIYRAYRDSQIKETKMQLANVYNAIGQYMADKHACPSSMDDLKTAGLIDNTKDDYGHDVVMTCPDAQNPAGFSVVSAGPDGQTGTADDIVFDPSQQ